MDPTNISVQRSIAQQKQKSARSNLLLMIILTVVNILMFALGSDSMLLFSASIPYYLAVLGILYGQGVLMALCICVCVIILVVYLMCWLFSKDHYGWMIAALVFFGIDCLFMALIYLGAGDASGILDMLMHVWVLYYLIIGVKYGRQLKLLPEEEPEQIFDQIPAEAEEGEIAEEPAARWSTPLRRADDEVKARVFLEQEHNGHRICYRRVKCVNELVIDGYVYADVTMLMETTHDLSAHIDGHFYQAGFDGVSHSYMKADGQLLARRLRIY